MTDDADTVFHALAHADRRHILDIVRDGVDGVLYSNPADPEAIAQAIDKCREMGFNKLNLSQRAARFSSARFEEQFQSLLASLPLGPER